MLAFWEGCGRRKSTVGVQEQQVHEGRVELLQDLHGQRACELWRRRPTGCHQCQLVQ
jgi:hypothetical protein